MRGATGRDPAASLVGLAGSRPLAAPWLAPVPAAACGGWPAPEDPFQKKGDDVAGRGSLAADEAGTEPDDAAVRG